MRSFIGLICTGIMATSLFSVASAADSILMQTCLSGDSCYILDNGLRYPIHVKGVDAPKPGQPFFNEAKAFLSSLVTQKYAYIKCEAKIIGEKQCSVKLNDGTDVAETLVKNGYAWDNPLVSEGVYKKLQEQAETKQIGLWASPKDKIVSPYCWKNPKKKNCDNPRFQPTE